VRGGKSSLLDIFHKLVPISNWSSMTNIKSLKPDIEAGIIGAILILPQSIALATLAGMPPEYGIYTSIFPVIIASLWGSSKHTLSGPNTAICVMIAFSVAPFASVGSEYYIGYVLALTLMVGVIQMLMGVLKLGALLDFISHTVIKAIVLAVGLIMIVSAMNVWLGVLSNIWEPFFIRFYQVIQDLPRANVYSVAVGLVTIISGIMIRRYSRRYALIAAVSLGSMFSALLNLSFGSATTQIELLGHLSLSMLPLSLPNFDIESLYVIKALIGSAFAIAFLGLMQTVVISRSIAHKSGQHIDTNQEIIGQGLSNLTAPFISSFAGSGSFNRSAAHYEAGAKTPLSAIYASIILGVIVFTSAQVIAYLPMPAIAGVLILVGYGLIDFREAMQTIRAKQESLVYLLTLFSALTFGLNAGVFTGLFISLVIYMWFAATPNIKIEEYTARNGRLVQAMTIDGNLFFGSVRHVEKALEQLANNKLDNPILLIRTEHITYIDASGANLIASETKRREESGGNIYIYTNTDNVSKTLEQAGYFDHFDKNNIIHKNVDHPMKDVLHPYQKSDWNNNKDNQTKNVIKEIKMEALAKRIRTTRLLGPLSLEQLTSFLEQSPIITAPEGDIIIKESKVSDNHLLLLEGELEVQRTWSIPDYDNDKSFTWTIKPGEADDSFCFLGAASSNIRARALSDIRYMLLDAVAVDDMVGWNQQFSEELDTKPEFRRRMNLVRNTSVFHQLPMEIIKSAFDRLQEKNVAAGDVIMTQGDEGDAYYIIDEGEAKIMRTDPFTDETKQVALIAAGDAFGEESLIQGGYRNATVIMTTPGKLLVLSKSDFDELVSSSMVSEITAEEAYSQMQNEQKQFIDCRYDMEYEESRIPGANFVPLDQLRFEVHNLNPDTTYIVYCRSGRRSKAAAFLLKERHINAVSLAGGIKDWPYEIDTSVVDLTSA